MKPEPGSPYSESFYNAQRAGSEASARIVVPIIHAIFRPSSVVDVGCGLGTWLAAFGDSGVVDIAGIDGHWVDPELLCIPEEAFTKLDLSRPFSLERTFDLALCLEVAEHLEHELARTFVGSLVSLSSIVVFSAAIPAQGGTHHVNERWPDYWRGLFAEYGYTVVDCLRPRIWQEDEVDYWYAQNMLVFVQHDVLSSRPELSEMARRTQLSMLNLVHPRMFLVARNAPPPEARMRSLLRRGRNRIGRLARQAFKKD